MRTFAPSDWHAAQEAWAEGEFSSEWRELRHTMAMQGCIYPPAGTRWDSWEDDSPSQRAILIRAIRETPGLLARCARGATSWRQLIDRLLAERDEIRVESHRRDRDPEDRPTHREAAMSVGQILVRLASSIGTEQAMSTPVPEGGDAP